MLSQKLSVIVLAGCVYLVSYLFYKRVISKWKYTQQTFRANWIKCHCNPPTPQGTGAQ